MKTTKYINYHIKLLSNSSTAKKQYQIMATLFFLLSLAIFQQVVFTGKPHKLSDDIPTAEELDARLERIQKTLQAALENKAILRQGEDPKDVKNSHKVALTEEEQKHVKNIMSGIEEDDSSMEDIDKLDAIFSEINDKFDQHERAQEKYYHNAEKMRTRMYRNKRSTNVQSKNQLNKEDITSEKLRDSEVDHQNEMEIEEEK